MDVLSLSMFRSVFSIIFMIGWFWLQPPPVPHTPRQRWIALGVGVLFAGIVFGLFKAIELVDRADRDPDLFHLSAAHRDRRRADRHRQAGLARRGRGDRGVLRPCADRRRAAGRDSRSPGLAFAVGAACLRTAVLLITRAALHGADSRLLTWYTLVSSTAIFVVFSLATWNWHAPQTGTGWVALLVVSVTVTIAVLTLFISINRIGPFRSALIMNLEPLLATILSAPLLGEVMTPLQGSAAPSCWAPWSHSNSER